MSSRKLFKGTLLILWCILIYSFSAANGDASQQLSDGILQRVGLLSLPYAGTLIRKLAHFLEYGVLALLAASFLEEFPLKENYRYAFLFALLYAVGDELHQLFVAGRAGMWQDVLIDAAGALVFLLCLRHRKRN